MSDQDGGKAPKKIGKYEVLNVLGRGGMGVVYRARDSRIGREVAIKTLTEGFSGQPDMLRRFYQEAGHTGNLRHPNIVTVYDFGDEDGLPYIVMEYLDGQPLDRIIREKESVALSVRVDIVEQICEALAYAHQQGMIHRDVKPANVVVQRDGVVKLLDFGIARAEEKVADGTITRTGMLVGTPAYMAPERLRGEPFDGRSDIFSTGVVFYQLLTGALPFDAEYPGNLHQILHEEPPPLSRYLSSYPPQLDAILARALGKDPSQRYARADEMADDLKPVSRQLRSQRSSELLAEARAAVTGQQYDRARELLSQILRGDSHHTGARRLLGTVERQLTKQATRQRVQQMVRLAQEAIASRDWDQAKSVCAEALKLEAANREVAALLAKAEAGTQAREQIQQLLREAEIARHAGDYEAARRTAGKASQLDPADSRIQAICRILDQEAEDARRKAQLRELLKSAQGYLSAGRLADASMALNEAEQSPCSDPELLRLHDDLADAMRREERKRFVQTIQERVELAVTHEDLLEVMKELRAGMEKCPGEPVLLRLKLQLEPRLRDQENRKLIADVSRACQQMPPGEALTCLREALAKLPGNPELLALEAAVAQRLTRTQRDQMLAGYLARAHALLEDRLYLEAVKVLEECQGQGFSSPELAELLSTAKEAEAQQVSQDLVERSFLHARRLLEQEDYEAVVRLLEPVLQRVEDARLRRQLEEARQKQGSLEESVDQVLSVLSRYRELGLLDAAIRFTESQPSGVKSAERVRAAVQAAGERLRPDQERLEAIGSIYAVLDRPGGAAGLANIQQKHGATEATASIRRIEENLSQRLRRIAEEKVKRCIEAAGGALASENAATAEELLRDAAAWKNNCSAELQANLAAIGSEIAATRKVLRFRRGNSR